MLIQIQQENLKLQREVRRLEGKAAFYSEFNEEIAKRIEEMERIQVDTSNGKLFTVFFIRLLCWIGILKSYGIDS